VLTNLLARHEGHRVRTGLRPVQLAQALVVDVVRPALDLRDKTKSYEILPYAPEEVGVYLGCKMSKGDRDEIIEIMRRKYPQAKIFQASKMIKNIRWCFMSLHKSIAVFLISALGAFPCPPVHQPPRVHQTKAETRNTS
jgi:hypothetical protein